jgi:hypothetical protein
MGDFIQKKANETARFGNMLLSGTDLMLSLKVPTQALPLRAPFTRPLTRKLCSSPHTQGVQEADVREMRWRWWGARHGSGWVIQHCAYHLAQQWRGLTRRKAMRNLRLLDCWEFRSGGRSRGRFATPTDSPLQDRRPYRVLHARRERVGCVHRSSTISCRAVPNPNRRLSHSEAPLYTVSDTSANCESLKTPSSLSLISSHT